MKTDGENITRVALITGAGSGLGETIAVRFAREGMEVGVLDINLEHAQSVAQRINDTGGLAIALQADISKEPQVYAAVSQLRSAFGSVSVLVNSASIEGFCAFGNIDEEHLDHMIGVNLKGVFFISQAVLPDMEAAGWGRIINIEACEAQSNEGFMGHYYASKGGVLSLTRSMAAELGPKGIAITSISLGFVDTAMLSSINADDDYLNPEGICVKYPLSNLGRAEELAAECAYFVFEEVGYGKVQLVGLIN